MPISQCLTAEAEDLHLAQGQHVCVQQVDRHPAAPVQVRAPDLPRLSIIELACNSKIKKYVEYKVHNHTKEYPNPKIVNTQVQTGYTGGSRFNQIEIGLYPKSSQIMLLFLMFISTIRCEQQEF